MLFQSLQGFSFFLVKSSPVRGRSLRPQPASGLLYCKQIRFGAEVSLEIPVCFCSLPSKDGVVKLVSRNRGSRSWSNAQKKMSALLQKCVRSENQRGKEIRCFMWSGDVNRYAE